MIKILKWKFCVYWDVCTSMYIHYGMFLALDGSDKINLQKSCLKEFK